MEPNPRIPDFLRAVTWVECGVVAGAAGLLYTLPTWGGQDIWAWQTPPFNARYIGSIYVGALVPLLILAITARWSPGRIVLWMIFVFTTAILLVMLAYTDRFEWARFATWLFWALYVFLPVNSAVFLWRLRDLPLAGATTRSPAASAGLTLLALAMGGYGLALLAVPEDAASFWPWPVDDFHGRIYAAAYLTPAAGALVVRRAGSRDEYRTLGITLAAGGVAAVLAIFITDPGVEDPWGFYALNLVPALIGVALVTAAPGRAPAASPA